MTFIQEVQNYVNLSHAEAWRKAQTHPLRKAPDEPALVASLLSNGMYVGLTSILRRHLAGSPSVLVRGIFTHQTPKVKVQGERCSIEIGDLMLVHKHYACGRRLAVTGRALLMQAKRTVRPYTGSLANQNESIQFNLYQKWPKFKLKSGLIDPLRGAYWDFKTLGAQHYTRGGEYVTVFDGWAYLSALATPQWAASVSQGPGFNIFNQSNYAAQCTWNVGACPTPPSTAQQGVSCADDFGIVLRSFLTGKRGRAFDPQVVTGSDHWSIFVNHMLKISGRKGGYRYKLANQGELSGERVRNLFFLDQLDPAFIHSFLEEHSRSMQHSLMQPFQFTKRLLDVMHRFNSYGNDLPPQRFDKDFEEFESGGHVPILLILTFGEESQLSFSLDE